MILLPRKLKYENKYSVKESYYTEKNHGDHLDTFCCPSPPHFVLIRKLRPARPVACPSVSGWLRVEPGSVSVPSSVLLLLVRTALTALSVTGAQFELYNYIKA